MKFLKKQLQNLPWGRLQNQKLVLHQSKHILNISLIIKLLVTLKKPGSTPGFPFTRFYIFGQF